MGQILAGVHLDHDELLPFLELDVALVQVETQTLLKPTPGFYYVEVAVT